MLCMVVGWQWYQVINGSMYWLVLSVYRYYVLQGTICVHYTGCRYIL